jgi:hypothetical protein
MRPDGQVAVFGRGADGALWERPSADGVSWSPWTSLGGLLLDDPVVVTTPGGPSSGRTGLTVVVRGLDRRAWVRSYLAGVGWTSWHPWWPDTWNGPLTATASTVTGVVSVAGLADGSPGPKRLTISPNGVPTASSSTGAGSLVEAPTFSASDELGIARDGTGDLRFWSPGQPWWSTSGGGVLTEAPIFGPALALVGGTVLARGTDGAVWSWASSGWSTLGGSIIGPPVGAGVDEQRFVLAARGLDHGVWIRTYDHRTGVWAGWSTLGGIVTAPPALFSIEVDRLAG